MDDLAARFGIEAEFIDAHGTPQHISAEATSALLAALGSPVADEAAAQRALAESERDEWSRPLAPVLVTSNAAAVAIPVTRDAGTTSLRWRVLLEDGGEQSGRTDFARLQLLGQRTFDGRRLERRELVLPLVLSYGYHQVRLEEPDAVMTLIVSPGQCVLPVGFAERKAWGVAAQLYLLRSERNWGIGDYGDLRALIESTAKLGADVVGLNPLHALFLDEPEHASPYSPASRLLLNVLNIDVEAVPEFATCAAAREVVAAAGFQARLAANRAATLVRYSDVAELKLTALRLVFEHGELPPQRRAAFEQFVTAGGEALRRGCLFQALRTHFAASAAATSSWRTWPAEFQAAGSPAVAQFASERNAELQFLAWLQWIADEQLAAAAAAAAHAGMRIGLYRDLAVGADPAGAEIWSNPAAVVQAAAAGAPPDIYIPDGQNWGLPPFHPVALRAEAYRSFIDLVRANMRHAGAIRIDHVMALQHLYLIPAGAEPSAGAYVSYGLADLIGILALESARHGCLVIGEDLGTVPAGFRERMAAANILSYRVLFFESDAGDGSFLPPDAYPKTALAVVGSHDMPTLRGWLRTADIDLRQQLGLLDEAQAAEQHERRTRERDALLIALRKEHLLEGLHANNYGALLIAVHAFLARSPALLAMAQIDDVMGESGPVNVPATGDEHPNWRRRLAVTLEEFDTDGRLIGVARAFSRAGRGHAW